MKVPTHSFELKGTNCKIALRIVTIFQQSRRC